MIIDRKMWDDMRTNLGTISMPLMAHQQVQQLLNHIEHQANAAAAAAENAAAAATTPPPENPRRRKAKTNGGTPPETVVPDDVER